MVGDRSFDVEAAAACGLSCVGVTYGGGTSAVELAGACCVVDSVADLRRVLLEA